MPKLNSILHLTDTFPTEQSCIDYLEKRRWPNGVISPFDPASKVYKCKNNKYRCKNTGKYFNVKTNTIYHGSKLSLRTWFMAFYLITSHKKGLSSVQLSKYLGVTQKTAWLNIKKIHKLLIQKNITLSGDIEVDETYVGGKNKNRHKDKKVKYSQGRSYKDKTPVFGIMQRNGMLYARVVPDVKGNTLKAIIYNLAEKGSTIHSDEWRAYTNLSRDYNHSIVYHARKEYVSEDGQGHCNSVEGAWAHLKRMVIGTNHWISKKHLQRYIDYWTMIYNTRNISDGERFEKIILKSYERKAKMPELRKCS